MYEGVYAVVILAVALIFMITTTAILLCRKKKTKHQGNDCNCGTQNESSLTECHVVQRYPKEPPFINGFPEDEPSIAECKIPQRYPKEPPFINGFSSRTDSLEVPFYYVSAGPFALTQPNQSENTKFHRTDLTKSTSGSAELRSKKSSLRAPSSNASKGPIDFNGPSSNMSPSSSSFEVSNQNVDKIGDPPHFYVATGPISLKEPNLTEARKYF